MKVNSVYKLCYEPMDIVYTWVNGSDPIHKALLREFTDQLKESMKHGELHDDDDSSTGSSKSSGGSG